jgi:hypothetical protein
MIALELARKLKDAGLVWEPKEMDFYILYGDDEQFFEVIDSTTRLLNIKQLLRVGHPILWLPSLSQLLAEIEGRGHAWDLWVEKQEEVSKYWLELEDRSRTKYFEGAEPEEATGLGLLWILRGGQDA